MFEGNLSLCCYRFQPSSGSRNPYHKNCTRGRHKSKLKFIAEVNESTIYWVRLYQLDCELAKATSSPTQLIRKLRESY
jgi:hypothetical protein